MGLYKRKLDSEFGTLFGLDIRELTAQQLQKIEPRKLIEFVDHDPRVEEIVCNNIKNSDIESAHKTFKRFDELNDISQKPKILQSYNDYVKLNYSKIDDYFKNSYFSSRDGFLKWELLNNNLRKIETQNFIEGKSTVFNPGLVDYSWLHKKSEAMATLVAAKVMVATGYQSSNWQQKLMATMPSEMMPIFMFPIFRDKKKYRELTFHTLSNPETPQKFIIKAVRNISRRSKDIPKINVVLGKSIWKQIPTVTRLNCMESIVYHAENRMSINFGDIKTEDDIKELMFSALLQYHERVERLLKVFIQNYTNQGS